MGNIELGKGLLVGSSCVNRFILYVKQYKTFDMSVAVNSFYRLAGYGESEFHDGVNELG